MVTCSRCGGEIPGVGIVAAEFLCQACRSAKVETVSPGDLLPPIQVERGQRSDVLLGPKVAQALSELGREMGNAIREPLATAALRGLIPKQGCSILMDFSFEGAWDKAGVPQVEIVIHPDFTKKAIEQRLGKKLDE